MATTGFPHQDKHAHGPNLPTYFGVFAALLVLTVLTAQAVYFPMPSAWHTPVALAIAAVKATLVLMIFMHLLYSPRLNWLIAFGSLLWLAIMMVLTFADYLMRECLQY
jgi:cytochrome c oxidase subunit IV